jgi:hypothetical protein
VVDFALLVASIRLSHSPTTKARHVPLTSHT